MRDAGALLSNLPALLVIVRSPTQVGKFASVFVQLLQKYLFNFYISICSTFTTVFVQHLHPYLSKPLIRFVISQLAQPSASKQLSDHPVSMGHLYVLTRLATPHVGKSTISERYLLYLFTKQIFFRLVVTLSVPTLPWQWCQRKPQVNFKLQPWQIKMKSPHFFLTWEGESYLW